MADRILMTLVNRPKRRALATYLLVALPVLSGAIPALDMERGDGRPLVEAQHHPETHGFPHDHLICIQQHANQWAPATASVMPVTVEITVLRGLGEPKAPPFIRQLVLPHPRAPPTI